MNFYSLQHVAGTANTSSAIIISPALYFRLAGDPFPTVESSAGSDTVMSLAGGVGSFSSPGAAALRPLRDPTLLEA